MLNKKELIKEIQNLSYKEKIELIFKEIVPQSDFHNYKWREKIQLESLGIIDNRGNRIHGEDSITHSLKSGKISKNKNGIYKINDSTTLGTFGRIDKDNNFDNKDTLCTLFNDEGSQVLSIIIFYNDEFNEMYKMEQSLKRGLMVNNKQTRDSVNINFNLINKYHLTYEILYKNPNVTLPI